MKRLLSIFFLLQFLLVGSALAQDPGSELDSLRKMEEEDVDSVIFTSKYIRYTDRQLLNTATQTVPIDTTLGSFQNYSPLYQAKRPTIGLGSLGIAYRDLLFSPSKKIGFDPGFHALDHYLMTQDDVRYYRARSPYTDLYYVNGSFQEQIFRVIHTQNIKPNWNFGANYNRIGAEGFYANQDADHLNAALFTWYESPGKRYNLLANALFNTIKAGENGSTTNDSIFTRGSSIRKDAEEVRLSATRGDRPRQTWRQKSFFIKQMYYIGRMDSLKSDSLASQILPTQRVSHSVNYTMDRYRFFRN
ncbi:MAG TPA: putative porin, partial [Daejeonella sp.]|nr:putative porin [Daejeonella sp.]